MSAPLSPVKPWNSTIGLKLLMAVTGLMMVGFVAFHMVGHLQMFQGRTAYNDYAAFMQGLGGVKWLARLGLLGVIAVHVGCAVTLTMRNQHARPNRYAVLRAQRTTLAGRTMLLSGWVVVAFVVFHILHFTAEVVAYEPILDELERRDVYTNFVRSFQNPLLLGIYLVAVAAVSMHLSHSVSSTFRTLGLATGRFKAPLAKVGPAVGLVTGLGFAVVPVACMLRIISA